MNWITALVVVFEARVVEYYSSALFWMLKLHTLW